MAVAKYLIDKSVLARAAKPSVRDRLNSLNDRGLLATCAMVEMEMLFSVRSAAERDQLRGFLKRFDWLPLMDEVWQRATQVQCEFVDKGLHRSVKIPDLIIAATAERHGATVLHYDRDFDRIAEVTGQLVEWVVPRGSAD